MAINKKRKFHFIQEILDVLALVIFFFIYLKLQYQFFWTEDYPLEKIPTYFELFKSHYKALILFLALWFIISKNVALYAIFRRMKFVEIFKKFTYQITIFSIVVFAISGFKTSDLFSPQLGIIYLLTLFVLGLTSRFTRFNYYKNLHVNNEDISHALIIDQNDNTHRLIDTLGERKDIGIRLHKLLKKDDISIKDEKVLLEGKDFRTYIATHNINRIFVSQKGDLNNDLMYKITHLCEANLLPISFIPDSIYNGITQLNLVYIDTLPIFEIKRFPLDLKYNQFFKSIFDILFSLAVCIFLLSWLFPIIALLIFIDSKGPILFKQKRNGLNGKEFNCYKFRTMVESVDNSIKATERNDPRVTKIGKFLRKTSIDELPQFLNVLKGEMSIVGPRPHMISQDSYYREIISKYNLRHYVKPGITGLSQVKGFRGAIDSDEDMEKRIRTDIYYVRNWSHLLDIQIIFQTILLMLKGDDNAI